MRMSALILLILPECTGWPTTGSPPIPSQNTEPTMVTRRSDFSIEYTLEEGSEMSQGLHEYDNSLLIDGSTGVATFTSTRPGGDDPGRPIGTFRAVLRDAELDKLYSSALRIDPSQAPPPGEFGIVNWGTLSIRFRSPQVTWDQTLGLDPVRLEPFDPLLDQLTLLRGRLYENPEHALRLTVRREQERFIVGLENIGVSELAVLDPRPLGASNDHAWAGIRIAELPDEKPGYTSPPLVWETVALELPNASTAPRSASVLPAGKISEWPTQRWTASHPGPHLAQAVILDYEGPSKIEGRPRIRGALFSSTITFLP